ncbi:hypothetical protein CYY_003116 [Polysphondylium violaceum]|uniref:Uncharacterized protein n=1 Tax=Polysphondylium violaceum TaxID=133409 RepID=A0A8J4PV93_9MYCE|nr:hypothetical protein CYY_003116 [Polysphondylium violaceum]
MIDSSTERKVDDSNTIEALKQSCVLVRVCGNDPSSARSNSRSFSYTSNGKTIFSCSGFIVDKEKGYIITSSVIFIPFINDLLDKSDKGIEIDIILNTDTNVTLDSNSSNSSINSNNGRIYDPLNSWKSCKFIQFINPSESSVSLLKELGTHFIISPSPSSSTTTGQLNASTVSSQIDTDINSLPFGLVLLELIDKSLLKATVTTTNSNSNSKDTISQVVIGNSLNESSGNKVYVVGSPFGFISPTMFLNSISSGIICNQISLPNVRYSNPTLYLIDARCLPGNEGSAVFNRNGLLIGVVGPPIKSKNEKLPFTLTPVLPIHNFLSKLQQMRVCPPSSLSLLNSPPSTSLFANNITKTMTQNAIVLIQFKNSWGSGVLISENGYILTNAHLIIPSIPSLQSIVTSVTTPKSFDRSLYQDQQVDIRINDGAIKGNENNNNTNNQWFKGTIEYISHTHLDIALIKVDLNNNNNNNNSVNHNHNHNHHNHNNNNHNQLIKFNHVECNTLLNPQYGTPVVVLGYPLIPPTQNPSLSITKGIISNIVYVDQCAVSYQTTASVHSGNSGGGLFDLNGKFLGIVTCNAKQKNGSIITELNFTIPATSLIHFFSYANGSDPYALDIMKSTSTNKFLKALWKLQITPPPLTSNNTLKSDNNKLSTTVKSKL